MAAMASRRNPFLTSLPLYLTWRSSGTVQFAVAISALHLRRGPFLKQIPVPGMKVLETFKEEFEIGSRSITFETGKIARFANGAVVMSMDETKVLSTVASSKGDAARDFLPLTVDYQEKQFAQGVIPTTFMRREGAPRERELLCGRLIDRPIRPLFPTGFYHGVQIFLGAVPLELYA